MSCAFCEGQDVKHRTITENESAFVFVTNIPIVPGHVVVAPKRHIKYYEALTKEEKENIEELRLLLKATLKKTFGAEGFNYAWNEEIFAGQSVPHFHLHIVPRKEGDTGIYEYEPRKFLYRPGSREESPIEELDSVVALLKSQL